MKPTLALFAISLSLSPAYAKHGNSGEGTHNRIITCVNEATQEKVLEFNSALGEMTISVPRFQLSVRSRGDDIGEMILTDQQSQDRVKAKRLEEDLKVTLITDEDPNPQTAQAPSHKGLAQIQLAGTNSGDQVQVSSYSRKSKNWMTIELVSDEAPAEPIRVTCRS